MDDTKRLTAADNELLQYHSLGGPSLSSSLNEVESAAVNAISCEILSELEKNNVDQSVMKSLIDRFRSLSARQRVCVWMAITVKGVEDVTPSFRRWYEQLSPLLLECFGVPVDEEGIVLR